MIAPRLGIDWSSQPLGQDTDCAIARDLGCSPTTVQGARRLRGIPVYKRSTVDKAGLAHLLGVETDLALARRVGVREGAVRAVRKARGIPSASAPRVRWDDVPDLGVEWDASLARRLGVTPAAVFLARRRRGIPTPKRQAVCPCGQTYTQRREMARWCSTECGQGAAWANREGYPPDAWVALKRLRQTIESKDRGHVE